MAREEKEEAEKERCLPCEAAGFTRSRENLFGQASSYALVSKAPVVWTNQLLRITGSYGCGLGGAIARDRP